MRKLLAVVLLTLLPAVAAFADQLNFDFGFGGANSVTATLGGLTSGPAALLDINDSTTGVSIPVVGTFVHANTGAATSITEVGNVVTGFFDAGGASSVLVKDALNNVLVAGRLDANSALVSTVPVGAGIFAGTFRVTFVSPVILAEFGQNHFTPDGSVALTAGGAEFDGTTYTATIGGGAVTVETSVVPEPAGLGLLGTGLLTIAEGLRRWRARKTS